MSERRVCLVLGQHRSTQRRIPRGRDDEQQLTEDIVALARRYGRYGYRKIAELLRSSFDPRIRIVVERGSTPLRAHAG